MAGHSAVTGVILKPRLLLITAQSFMSWQQCASLAIYKPRRRQDLAHMAASCKSGEQSALLNSCCCWAIDLSTRGRIPRRLSSLPANIRPDVIRPDRMASPNLAQAL